MAYRILKITSSLYRIWASTRMRDLEDWIRTWADKAHFAGVPGAGAEDAWYLTQVEIELLRLSGSQVSAGSIDVFKCFDQIVRELIVELARRAGMPTDILNTYQAFLEDLTVRLQIGNTLGVEHKHKCSIPQGCPFSMTLIGLLMRPWIMMMRDKEMEPRVLADDLFFYAAGKRHATNAVQGMKISREYFRDIGAKVADNKCLITSTCQNTCKIVI